MIDLKEIEKFDVSETTKGTYRSIANKFNTFIGKTKINHFKRIMKLLNKNIKINSTRLNYLKLLSKLTKDNKKLNDKYVKEIKDLNDEIKKDVPKKLKKLKEETKNIDYDKIKTKFIKGIKDKKYDTTLREFILSLYLLHPPRRLDYNNMIYITKRKDIKDKQNYLLKEKSKYSFIFKNFKNVKKMGDQEIKITNKDLLNIINKREFKKGEQIYPKSKRTYERDIKKITKEVFGKELTINTIRKLHSSNLFGAIKGIEEDSFKMGHRPNTKIKNYLM